MKLDSWTVGSARDKVPGAVIQDGFGSERRILCKYLAHFGQVCRSISNKRNKQCVQNTSYEARMPRPWTLPAMLVGGWSVEVRDSVDGERRRAVSPLFWPGYRLGARRPMDQPVPLVRSDLMDD